MIKMKIGMYTEDDIFKYMTDCEGSMLGRSMYDAIFDKIHALITENEQLKNDNAVMKAGLIQVKDEKLEQLQNNWNELKKWLEEEYEYYDKHGSSVHGYAMGQIRRTENKMQELEQGKDE